MSWPTSWQASPPAEVDSTSVFAALADPTRQQLIDWLAAEQTGTATGFAERLPISRQAVAKHLSELEEAGLVSSARVGRETRYTLIPGALDGAIDWLTVRAASWDRALARLKKQVEKE